MTKIEAIIWSDCSRVYVHPISAKHGHWTTDRKEIHRVVAILAAQPILKSNTDGYYSVETGLGFFAAIIQSGR